MNLSKPYAYEYRNPAVTCLIALALIAVLLPAGCKPSLEKTASFKAVFDHYRDREDIVAISFPPGLVGLFLSDSDPGQAELKKLMQELSAFRMLSVKEGSLDADMEEELRSTVNGFTERNEFQDLIRMQTGGEDIFIRIREKNGMVREAILMLSVAESFFVIDLRGNISLAHFTRLAEGGYLDELTSLAKIDF